MKRYIKAYMLKDSDMVVLDKEDIKNAKDEDFKEVSLIIREKAELTYKLILKKRAAKEKARKEADTHGIENHYKIEGRMRQKKGFFKSIGAYGRKF